MNNEVWLVRRYEQYESSLLLGIYRTQELARREADRLKANRQPWEENVEFACEPWTIQEERT